MKIPPPVFVPARPLQGPRAEALRAAQRAFFNAAAGRAGVPAPKPEPAAPTPAPAQSTTAAAEPRRYPRPGSVLDIKV